MQPRKKVRYLHQKVSVDPERGVPVPREHEITASPPEKDKLANVFRNPCGDECHPIQTTVEEESKLARASYDDALDLVSSLTKEIIAGRTIKTQAIEQTLGKLTASILRNPDAFMWPK